jgi:hypothetical protein
MTRQQLVNCSTATQTIFDAFWPLGMYPDDMDASNLAAALRAVVQELKYFGITEKNILAIAAELEAQ